MNRHQRLAALDARIFENIARAGWHLQGVFPTVDGPKQDAFMYTIGLGPKVGYELLAIGNFPSQTIGDVLNRIGQKFVTEGVRTEGLIDIDYSVPFKLRLVESMDRCADQYTCMVRRFAPGPYKVVQVLLQDKFGVWQDDPACAYSLVDLP